jgi:hypothetical protein
VPWRRPRGGRRGGPALLALVLIVLGAAKVAVAQAINYTVQVVALSDSDAALVIVNDLLRQGYPAYAVRSTSTQGAVFRVRVGAFANRQAALHYAEAMPDVGGGRPVPALAEAIPPGITPLAPRLLLQEDVSGREARLLALPGGVLALRLQWRVPLRQAEYVTFRAGVVERVNAWQLVESQDGVRLRVRDLPLWPDAWQQESADVRQGYLNNLVALIADRLGVGVAEVMAGKYVPPGDEVPRLIVVERVVLGAADGPELLGLGLPASGMTPSGPIAYLGIDPGLLPAVPESARLDLASRSVTGTLAEATWSGVLTGGAASGAEAAGEAEPEPVDEAPVQAAQSAPAQAVGEVLGAGWSAVPDGKFVRITVLPTDGGPVSSWRACVGTPLWSDGQHLLALHNGVLLVYDFLPRQ